MYNINPYVFKYGQIFFTNRFIKNFIQLTYKSDMCSLNVREAHIFLLMLLKYHVIITFY
jgi:hypothetical protein